MASSQEKDDNFYKSVLNRSHSFLIKNLDPVSTLDAFITEEYLQRVEVRDIKELRTSSEKIREIVEKVKSKGTKGYVDFKRILRTTNQERIAVYLSNQEQKMAAAIKKEAAAPPQQQLPAILARKPTEKDLSKIAEAIGSNWEILGPHLISEHSTSLVEQIKMDNDGAIKRIYKLLLIWTREAGHLATFGRLFFLMHQAGSSVTIEWDSIATYLNITLEDIRACKDGFDTSSEAPVAQQLSNQDEEEMKVIYDRTFDRQSGEEKEYRHPKDSCIYDGRLLKLEKKDIE